MKKRNLFLIPLLLTVLSVNAQQYVSTTPQNRNVVLEEFTGINCQNCPDGHRIANSLMAVNPGRVWAVNIHSGNYAPMYYPNFTTTDGSAISAGFNISAWPNGLVNRTTEHGLSRTEWASNVNQQLTETAECNVGGNVIIDSENRTATIKVEVYYTSNSSSSTNYINVIMMQDSIMGPQEGAGYNSDQIINGQYCHLHAFRDAITPTWGEAISPTTAGTLITKTFTYNIPTVIGTPNGIDVDIDNLHFLAFVTEQMQGTPSRPILNANELSTFMGTNQNIYPYITNILPNAVSCNNDKVLNVTVANGGLQELTSLDFEITVDGGSVQDYAWNGNISSYNISTIQVPVTIPAGNHEVVVKIVKANGSNFNTSKSVNVNSEGLQTVNISADEEELTIEIMQDKYGYQITWEVLDVDNNVIASGGPYEYLSGSSATLLHEEKLTVSDGDCVMFIIKDDGGNGICCQYGEGYYKIKNAQGEVVVDGDGAFGNEAKNLLTIVKNNDGIQHVFAEICEDEDYTEYGFNIIAPEVGVHQYENEYNGITYMLTLTVIETPTISIVGDTEISQGETAILIASGADAYLWSTGDKTPMIVVSPEETTKYTVVGTKDGCEGTAEITVNVAVGDEENVMNDVKIYPNPTQGKLNIECEGMQEIVVFMPNGQTVERIIVDANNHILDMSNYKTGVYYIKIISDKGMKLVKSIKM